MLESPIKLPKAFCWAPWYDKAIGYQEMGGRSLWSPCTGKLGEHRAAPRGNRCLRLHCFHKCAKKEMWKKAEES